MTTQDPELSAALGWPGGISDPVLDRTQLLRMVAALRLASQQALEALVIGQDTAYEVAQNYHQAMAGYRPARHIAVDDDVLKIGSALTALRAALAQEQLPTEVQK